MQSGPRPRRILRIIARLNVGGPAIQAITLTRGMAELGYETVLVRGSEGAREGSMDWLAESLGVLPILVPSLGRELGPHDLRAYARLRSIIRRQRPDIVHTHAAKAGTLGRLAALLSARPRPVIVHTFHGHVLEGYFSWPKATLFRVIERFLARHTTRIIAVSPEVRDDLIRLRIAPPERITVVRLGFELGPFLLAGPEREQRRASFRSRNGVADGETLVTLVARLVPVKRVDRFLRVANLLRVDDELRFMIVGDGELNERLRASEAAARLGDRLIWHGFTDHISDVYFGSDIVVLTSDNEGTPVSLIEAQAAAVPVVSTRVGGVCTVVQDGVSGCVVDRHDERGIAAAISGLARDPERARALGLAGRSHTSTEFTLHRLIGDLDRLYRDLLAEATH